jgi:hypothetical protein
MTYQFLTVDPVENSRLILNDETDPDGSPKPTRTNPNPVDPEDIDLEDVEEDPDKDPLLDDTEEGEMGPEEEEEYKG